MDLNKDKLLRYRKFISQISFLRNKDAKLGHWDKAIQSFNLDSVKDDGGWLEAIDKKVENSEFGFRSFLRGGNIFLDFKFLKDLFWSNVVKLLRRATEFLTNGRSHKYEHARALDFIKRKGLMPAYLEFIKPFGIKSSMAAIRHFYYLKTLEDTINVRGLFKNSQLNFLEIGAGAGNFGLFCFKKFNIFRYVIVDLPEMLGYSAYQFLKYNKEVDVVFANEFDEQFLHKQKKPTVYFLTPDQIGLLPENLFQVCLNFTSFSEMDKNVIDAYIKYIYRLGISGSLFYNINRFKQFLNKSGISYRNNPLLFPYSGNDEVLYFGIDEFHYATRTGLGVIPSMTIARIAIIKK